MSQLADEPRLRVVVFCASAEGDDPSLMALAREVGVEIAERGAGLVYGGGRVGLMGAVADGALSVGGEVIGVIPQQLVDREVAHLGLSKTGINVDLTPKTPESSK